MSTDIRNLTDVIPMSEGCALDIGGSNGLLRQYVEPKGYRYVNVDLRDLQSSWNDGILIQADAHNLPFRDETFDLVISNDCLEHVVSPSKVLVDAKRILREGGYLIAQIPVTAPFH